MKNVEGIVAEEELIRFAEKGTFDKNGMVNVDWKKKFVCIPLINAFGIVRLLIEKEVKKAFDVVNETSVEIFLVDREDKISVDILTTSAVNPEINARCVVEKLKTERLELKPSVAENVVVERLLKAKYDAVNRVVEKLVT